MNCAELKARVSNLRMQIAQKENQIDNLKNEPKTLEIIQEIDNLENEVIEIKKDVMRLNTQYKQNCQ